MDTKRMSSEMDKMTVVLLKQYKSDEITLEECINRLNSIRNGLFYIFTQNCLVKKEKVEKRSERL